MLRAARWVIQQSNASVLKIRGREMGTRRRVLASIVTFVALAALGLTNTMPVAATRAQAPFVRTHVCGAISTSTTWSASGSPYQLDCVVTVQTGVTLTIQPGVIVYAATGVEIAVDGTLIANGTSGGHITFTCLGAPCVANTWYGIQWGPNAGSASALSYVDFTGTAVGLYNFPGSALNFLTFTQSARPVEYSVPHSLVLQHDTFRDFSRGFFGLGGVVSMSFVSFQAAVNNNTAVSVFGGTLQVAHATFAGAQTDVSVRNASLTLSDSTLQADRQLSTGVFAGAGSSISMQRTPIQSTLYAIDGSEGPASLQISASSLLNNGTALYLNVPGNTFHVNQNNIYNNSLNVKILGGLSSAVVDASNNWWGTSDPNVIAAGIQDCRGNPQLPCVNYLPYLLGPPVVPPGPPVTRTPTPTATATSTASATPTPQVAAELQLQPSTEVAGAPASVSATGGGFGRGETVAVGYTVSLQGGGTATEQTTAATFANGTFVVQLPAAPANAVSGIYLVSAVGQSTHAVATAQLNVTRPPTSTPTPRPTATSTPTASPTNTPTATATPTPIKPFRLRFRSAYLWYHFVRVGTHNRVVIQANHRQHFDVSLHVIFPAGHDLHYLGHTDKRGHWGKTFAVSPGTISRVSRTALVIVELRHNLTTVTTALSFTLVR